MANDINMTRSIKSFGFKSHSALRQVAQLSILMIVVGCSKSTPPPAPPGLFQVSGKVTYNGNPVPAGYITFEPHEQGRTAKAEIKNGRFQTQPRNGHVGGLMKVYILAYDGKPVMQQKTDYGTPLWKRGYHTTMELPKRAATADFDLTDIDDDKDVEPMGAWVPADD